MKLSELFESGKYVVTSEVGPPKGVDYAKMMEDAELLRGKVDAINVTDQQSAVMRLGSLAVCRLLKERRLEPILQVTCRDRNRLALQAELLSGYVLGVENVLCLSGDYMSLGDHPESKPVFDLDSVTLLKAAVGLREGHDMAGNDLEGSPDYCLGAVVTPAADPIEPQIMKMEKKVAAGAQFFQTQAVYDARQFEEFIAQVKHLNVPIMLGIVLLKSAGMARFMNKNVAGVTVPEALVDEMDQAKDRRQKSVEIAARLIGETKDLCRGVHFMPLGWEKLVPRIMEEAGLLEASRVSAG